VLRQLPTIEDPNVLVGTAVPADAGVYRLSDDVALVQSVDLFTPVVDDPFDYGRIAAANSLSDLYAMGATPRTALNVVSFPKGVPIEVLVEMLRGGAEVAREAGVAILGGHTVQGPEPMYGLAVTGVVHPDRLVSNQGARPGDVLVLTKPLGLGILTTAHKHGVLPDDVLHDAVQVMATLNRAASAAMQTVGVHAATDITGYGLLGHLHELLMASGCAARVVAARVPVLEAAWALAAQNLVPGGSQSTFGYLTEEVGAVRWDRSLTWEQQILLCDAQTSGGLLIAVPGERLDALLDALEAHGVATRAVIGEVLDGTPGRIEVVAT